MKNISNTWRTLALAGIVSLGFGVSAALAGECPADQVKTDATKPGATANKDATDTVLAMIDLSKEPANIDRQFRIRRLVVQPGGEIAWHSHGDRPALIYIVSGRMTEYASNCAVPIVHKAGDVARETHETSHWWKNTGKRKAVLLSTDLLHDQADHNM
ncbi:MAG TPA: cupin domain-containing protein [Dongiaceae bacterium]|jgi:quercetin dioxygenase-like cupin family protein|nr:cupin domain-containing protein [Dongiaceae bacterium]